MLHVYGLSPFSCVHHQPDSLKNLRLGRYVASQLPGAFPGAGNCWNSRKRKLDHNWVGCSRLTATAGSSRLRMQV